MGFFQIIYLYTMKQRTRVVDLDPVVVDGDRHASVWIRVVPMADGIDDVLLTEEKKIVSIEQHSYKPARSKMRFVTSWGIGTSVLGFVGSFKLPLRVVLHSLSGYREHCRICSGVICKT